MELNQEPAADASELYLSLAVGPWRSNTATVPQRSSRATWAEQFIIREDDLMMNSNSPSSVMTVSFELSASKRWPVPDMVLATCELNLEEEAQLKLVDGNEAIVRMPLQPPGRLHQRLRAGVSSGSASQKEGTSSSSAAGGVLVISIKLQHTALDDALGGQLPGDLIPAVTVDATEASKLTPGSIVHTPLGHVFIEPTFVYLRIKLLGITGLKYITNPNPQKLGTSDPLQKISANQSTSSDVPLSSRGEPGGGITQIATQLVEGWTKQAFSSGLSWAKSKITSAVAAEEKSSQAAPAPQNSSAGSKFSSIVNLAKKGLAVAALASQEIEKSKATAVDSSQQTPTKAPATATATAAATEISDGSKAVGASSYRPPSSDEENDGVKVSPPSPPSPPTIEEDEYQLPHEESTTFSSPSTVNNTSDPAATLPPPLASAPSPKDDHRPTSPHPTSHAHTGSVDFDVLMGVLETNGFSHTDKGVFQFFWLRAAYEGQEHTSKMVPQDKGTASWEAHGEYMLISALRPVGASPIEFSLYGTRDPKSKGRAVAQVSLPLSQLLAAASIHRYRPPKSASDESCLEYDPVRWPRGKVTVKGKLDDGGSIDLLFEVVLVEGDARGREWGLPLILKEGVRSSKKMKDNDDKALVYSTAAEASQAASGWADTIASLPPVASSRDLSWLPKTPTSPSPPSTLSHTSLGTLHFIVHSVTYYTSERSIDSFFLTHMGHVWCMSSPQSSRSPSWGLHVSRDFIP